MNLEYLQISSDEEAEEGVEIARRRQRTFRDRINFGVAADFKEKFRVYPETAEYILREIGAELAPLTYRTRALSAQKKLLVALHFIGNGAQYHGVADMHGISKATVCRCVNAVATVIVDRLLGAHVRWPANNAQKIADDLPGFHMSPAWWTAHLSPSMLRTKTSRPLWIDTVNIPSTPWWSQDRSYNSSQPTQAGREACTTLVCFEPVPCIAVGIQMAGVHSQMH